MLRKPVLYSLLCFLLTPGIGSLIANGHPSLNAAQQRDPATPDVLIVEPDASTLKVTDEVLNLRVLVLSPMTPLTSVTMVINGSTKRLKLDREVDSTRRRFLSQEEIVLKPGENVIFISATNKKGSSQPVVRRVILEPAAAKPKLITLSIGVSAYGDRQFNQQHASRDAKLFDKFVDSQKRLPGLYGNVKNVVLTDSEVSREAFYKALAEFNSEVTSETDVRVMFLSGALLAHGLGDIYFLSPDYEYKSDPELSSVNLRAILARLADKPGSVLLFVNTNSSSFRLGQWVSGLLRAPSDRENFFIFVSSGLDEAVESPSTSDHSYFVKALIEGLQGEADLANDGRKDGVIDTAELHSWLKKRVAVLSENRQRPMFVGSPQVVAAFNVAAVQP